MSTSKWGFMLMHALANSSTAHCADHGEYLESPRGYMTTGHTVSLSLYAGAVLLFPPFPPLRGQSLHTLSCPPISICRSLSRIYSLSQLPLNSTQIVHDGPLVKVRVPRMNENAPEAPEVFGRSGASGFPKLAAVSALESPVGQGPLCCAFQAVNPT